MSGPLSFGKSELEVYTAEFMGDTVKFISGEIEKKKEINGKWANEFRERLNIELDDGRRFIANFKPTCDGTQAGFVLK